MKVLEKNPILAVKVQKKYFDFRIVDLMYKLYLCISYFFSKPKLIKCEKETFNQFMEQGCLLKISNKKATFWLPNLIWEENRVDGEYVQKKIYYTKDYYERDVLDAIKKNIPTEGVILDIGANIGNHTVFFSKECNAKKIYAFEPVGKTFEILQKNICINNLEKVVELYNAGIGSINGKAELEHFDADNFGSSRIVASENGSIQLMSIDEMNFNEQIKFVKIDVEGGEYNVLEGMKKRLMLDKPSIFIEIWDKNFEKVNKLLEQMNYHIEFKVGENYLYVCK